MFNPVNPFSRTIQRRERGYLCSLREHGTQNAPLPICPAPDTCAFIPHPGDFSRLHQILLRFLVVIYYASHLVRLCSFPSAVQQ